MPLVRNGAPLQDPWFAAASADDLDRAGPLLVPFEIWQAHRDRLSDRVGPVGVRLAHGCGMAMAFALGCLAAFLVLPWPPLLREVAVGYLSAVVILWLALAIGRCLFSPDEDRLRVLPLTGAAAAFWQHRLLLFVAWFAFGWITIRRLDTLGMPLEV